jgi:hypothetical protein
VFGYCACLFIALVAFFFRNLPNAFMLEKNYNASQINDEVDVRESQMELPVCDTGNEA